MVVGLWCWWLVGCWWQRSMFVYGGGRAMLVYGGVVLGFIIFFFIP